MVLNPSKSSSLEQLALKGLMSTEKITCYPTNLSAEWMKLSK